MAFEIGGTKDLDSPTLHILNENGFNNYLPEVIEVLKTKAVNEKAAQKAAHEKAVQKGKALEEKAGAAKEAFMAEALKKTEKEWKELQTAC